MKNNVSLSDPGWNLQNSYTQISDKLFSELKPDAVNNPSTVIINHKLAKKLGLNLNVKLIQLLSLKQFTFSLYIVIRSV